MYRRQHWMILKGQQPLCPCVLDGEKISLRAFVWRIGFLTHGFSAHLDAMSLHSPDFPTARVALARADRRSHPLCTKRSRMPSAIEPLDKILRKWKKPVP